MLVYGEDINDTSAIKELTEALRPDLSGRVCPRRKPAIEVKGARLEDLPNRAERLRRFIALEQKARTVVAVLAHQDCDDVEPAHQALTARIEAAFSALPLPVFAVTPAWEMEAWWFMFPAAVSDAFPTWRSPTDYVGRNVGTIKDAKQAFQRAVEPRHLRQAERRRFRGYAESDSRAISRSIRSRGEAAAPGANSGSYTFFCQRVAQIP